MGATWISWSLAVAMSHLISTSSEHTDGIKNVGNLSSEELVSKNSQSYIESELYLPLNSSLLIKRLNESIPTILTDSDEYSTLPTETEATSEQNLLYTIQEETDATTSSNSSEILAERLKLNLKYNLLPIPSDVHSFVSDGNARRFLSSSGLPTEFLPKPPFVRKPHPCSRECVDGERPKTCSYKFEVGWYYAMSKACHNCATNFADCYRQDCVSVDGFKRALITVNRQIPGPSIEVCLGDTVVVDLINTMPEETTSVHWHGHHQRDSPYMDGVPFITQCPVPPNSIFRYKYLVDNPGTHFWHSHSGIQRGDGIFGNFIVRLPRTREPFSSLYEFDLPEHTITILDWSHRLGVSMFNSHYHSDGNNKPDTIIVNGRGRYYNDSVKVTNTPLAAFSVKQRSSYRFRLINAGVQNCPIELSIDNHTMIIIGADGSDLQPKEVDTFVSYTGERWDFVLETDQKIDNYWMRFTGLMDCDERFTKAHQLAILHYEGASLQEPKGSVGYKVHDKANLQLNSLNVRRIQEGTMSVPDLMSLDDGQDDPSLKPVPDHQLYISYDFYARDSPQFHKPNLYGFNDVTMKDRVYLPQFNYITMKLPPFPLLSQSEDINSNTFCDHSKLQDCKNRFCECTNVYEVALGEVVELILVDKGVTFNGNHPFHLHGHAFRVIGMDKLGDTTDEETIRSLDMIGKIHRNFTNPPLKDTITVPDGGYTIVRFHASNPGYWLFHCHIEYHIEVGMALIFKVGEHSDFVPIPRNFPKCGNYFYDSPLQERSGQIKEIDFRAGDVRRSLTYNVTDNEVDSLLSLSHWWPYISNKTQSSGAEVKTGNTVIITFLVFTMLIALYLL